MPQHTDRAYETQLGKLRSCLLEMGGLVEDQITQAIRSLTERDPVLAGATVQRDHTVNRLDVEIDELSMKLIALHQPTHLQEARAELAELALVAAIGVERHQPNRPVM